VCGFPELTLPSSPETLVVALETGDLTSPNPGWVPVFGFTVAGQRRVSTGFADLQSTRR
jgi:hypothetical protein